MNGIELSEGTKGKFFKSHFDMRSQILNELENEINQKEKRFWDLIDLQIRKLEKAEFWRDIKNYEGLYEVSDKGKIKSLKRGKEKILKTWKSGGDNKEDRYEEVALWKNSKREKHYVHRLVAQEFLSNPDNLPEINHKDENKRNNCVSNLEYCSRQYNMEYSKSKKVSQYDLNGKLIKTFKSVRQASRELGASPGYISKCCNGTAKTCGGFVWKYEK